MNELGIKTFDGVDLYLGDEVYVMAKDCLFYGKHIINQQMVDWHHDKKNPGNRIFIHDKEFANKLQSLVKSHLDDWNKNRGFIMDENNYRDTLLK